MERERSKSQLEKEVLRLTGLLKRCEKKYNKQMIVYDRNMENLGMKMMEFEKSLLQEQLNIHKLLKEKDSKIETQNQTIKQLESVIEKLQSTKCNCPQKQPSNVINENDDASVITMPPLNLPSKVALQNVSFTNHRPFRPKSKLSPVAEESELTFSSTLRHVHADTNPEQFHALLTSRLLGSGLDELSRKNVTPVESSDSFEKVILSASEIVDETESGISLSNLCDQPIENYSLNLSESIISNALTISEIGLKDETAHKENIQHVENVSYEDFSNYIAEQILFTAFKDVKEYDTNKTTNVTDNRYTNNTIDDDGIKKVDNVSYDKVSVALVQNILDEVEQEFNHIDFNGKSSDTNKPDDCARLEEYKSRIGENISKIENEEAISSSSNFDEALDKSKTNTEIAISSSCSPDETLDKSKPDNAKSKKKKKKKKKKRKNNAANNEEKNVVTNGDKIVDNDNTVGIHNAMDGTHENNSNTVDEDKFSLLVDYSLNNLDDMTSDEITMGSHSNDRFGQSCSFEDLSSLLENKNPSAESAKVIDVSEYEVLS